MFKITGFDWLSQFKAILTHNELDQGLWDELEELFILSDIGIHSTQLILDNFKKALKLNKGTFSIDNAIDLLKKELVGFIDNCGTTELISLHTVRLF
jgi:signal recognition particle GTPase